MRHSLRRPFATHLQARNNYNSSVRIEKQTCKDSRGKRDISREQSKCRGYVSRRSSHRHRTVGPMLVHSHHRLHTRPACSTSDLLARRALQSSRPVPTGRRTGVHLEHCRPCRASSQDTDPSEGQQPSSIQDSPLSAAPSKQTNTLIAGGAALVGVALFAFTRLSVGPATLNTLQQVSIPYEEALTNGRPTLVEFYADWCSICRSTAPDVYQVQGPLLIACASGSWALCNATHALRSDHNTMQCCHWGSAVSA